MLTVLTAIAGVLSFVSPFLFSNCKLQLRRTSLGIPQRVVLPVLYFLEIGHFNRGDIALWCLFYFAILLFSLPAALAFATTRNC